MLAELQAIADHDLAAGPSSDSQFVDNFGPNGDLAKAAGGWTALPLMNKGALSSEGCMAAPRTCSALRRLATHLKPTRSAPEVGVRVLKLDVNATIRPHVGPGGRLVAHLGLRVPIGATLTVAGEQALWREGEFTVFDDALLHSARNDGTHARYVLHVAFPRPLHLPHGHVSAHSTNGMLVPAPLQCE